MKKRLLFIPLLLFCIGIQADDTESVKKQINSIKKDSQYIYADVTAGSVEDAKELAEEALYTNINEWSANQKKLGKNVASDAPKEKWTTLVIPRGNMFRSFMYVQKLDLLKEGSAESQSELPKQEVASAAPSASTFPDVVMDIASCTEYADLAAKITNLKEAGKISKYGRYASLDNPQDYYLAIYNREGKIVAVLSAGTDRVNVQTKQADSEKNYKGCGAIGFKMTN